MPLQYSPQEILETIRMVQMEKLDIRTVSYTHLTLPTNREV